MRKTRKVRKLKAPKQKFSLRKIWESWKHLHTVSPPPEQEKKEEAVITEPSTTQEQTTPPAEAAPEQEASAPTTKSLRDKWQELRQHNPETSGDENSVKRTFWTPRKRRLAYLLLIALAGVGTCAATTLHLKRKSDRIEHQLSTAISERDWETVHKQLALSEVSVYQFLNSSLPYTVGYAETWIQRQKEVHKQLQTHIEGMESGKIPVGTLSIHAIAEMERALRSLPAKINDLSKRWNALHANNRSLFQKNREYVMNQLLSAPDIETLLTQDAEEDCRILEEKIILWADYLETCNAYDIPRSLVQKGQLYHEELTQFHTEAQALKSFHKKVADVITYSELLRWRRFLSAGKYAPARKAFSFLHSLPDIHEWKHRMSPINQYIPHNKLNQAKAILMEEAPSFCAAFPASQEQYALADALFASPSLHKKFYCIELSHGPSYVSEEHPQWAQDAPQLRIILSDIDAAYDKHPTKEIICRAQPQAVKIRRSDCSGLLRACGIRREQFFSHAQLPQLLEKIAQYNRQECPQLAKAFVYDRILAILLRHPLYEPKLIKKLSPKLARDAASFITLRKKHAKVMYGGAWLHNTNQAEAAEKDFGAWFREHKNNNYNIEIEGNAPTYFQAKPHYIGYVDASATPILRHPLQPNMVIWYMGQNGIQATTPGQLPDAPCRYSPLFIDTIHK